MPRYDLDAATTSDYGAPSASAGARFGWQSRASELWALSALIGAGAGTAGLAVTTPLAIWQAWPWWLPPVATICTAGAGFCGAAVWLVRNDQHLRQAFAPTPARPAPAAKSEPRMIYVHSAPGVASKPELTVTPASSPADLARAEYVRKLQYWLEHVYAGYDPDWRTWEHHALPDGSLLSRAEWTAFCNLLLSAGLATRAHAKAALQIHTRYGDARRALREVLALPPGQEPA